MEVVITLRVMDLGHAERDDCGTRHGSAAVQLTLRWKANRFFLGLEFVRCWSVLSVVRIPPAGEAGVEHANAETSDPRLEPAGTSRIDHQLRQVVRQNGIIRQIYLAVPFRVYESLLSEKFGRLIVSRLGLRVLVFDHKLEKVSKWSGSSTMARTAPSPRN